MTDAEARIPRSDILGEIAISENLELESDIFDDMQLQQIRENFSVSCSVFIHSGVCGRS